MSLSRGVGPDAQPTTPASSAAGSTHRIRDVSLRAPRCSPQPAAASIRAGARRRQADARGTSVVPSRPRVEQSGFARRRGRGRDAGGPTDVTRSGFPCPSRCGTIPGGRRARRCARRSSRAAPESGGRGGDAAQAVVVGERAPSSPASEPAATPPDHPPPVRPAAPPAPRGTRDRAAGWGSAGRGRTPPVMRPRNCARMMQPPFQMRASSAMLRFHSRTLRGDAQQVHTLGVGARLGRVQRAAHVVDEWLAVRRRRAMGEAATSRSDVSSTRCAIGRQHTRLHEAAMVGTGAPSSAASCTAQRPVPFIDAESRIRSMRSLPVSGSLTRKMSRGDLDQVDCSSPPFHSSNVSASSAFDRPPTLRRRS